LRPVCAATVGCADPARLAIRPQETKMMTATSGCQPTFSRQANRDGQTAIVVTVLNRMLAASRQASVRCLRDIR
jgi:hypothetical protein